MSVSIRDYIRWLPDGAPTENTDTLVLTSPGRRFVDIRMLLSGTDKGELTGECILHLGCFDIFSLCLPSSGALFVVPFL